MNSRGQLAEMSPFGRPARSNTIPSNRRPVPPMEVSGDISKWHPPTYPLVGFSPGTFLSENKLLVSFGAAAVVGLIAYYKFGLR